MSEAEDKVKGVSSLPLFPLPVVLFPGVPLPLHIFEPRYRQMLDDVRAGSSLFGVSYFDSSSTDRETPAVGHIGCVAEITEVQALPEDRFNILTVGIIRYRVEEYLASDKPYIVGKVSFFEDDDETSPEIEAGAHEVAEAFTRIARAVRVINDERAQLPDISDTEPQRLSFLVAAAMEMEAEVKQELLELRSTNERLRRLSQMLGRAVEAYEERARIHQLAKGNGHSGRKINIE